MTSTPSTPLLLPAKKSYFQSQFDFTGGRGEAHNGEKGSMKGVAAADTGNSKSQTMTAVERAKLVMRMRGGSAAIGMVQQFMQDLFFTIKGA